MEYRYISCWQERACVYGILESPIHHLTRECNAVRIKKKMPLFKAIHARYKPANANNQSKAASGQKWNIIKQ